MEELRALEEKLEIKSTQYDSCFVCAEVKCVLIHPLVHARPAGIIGFISTFSRTPCYCREPGTYRRNYEREMFMTDRIVHAYNEVMLRHHMRIAALLVGVNSIIRDELPVRQIRHIVVAYLIGN